MRRSKLWEANFAQNTVGDQFSVHLKSSRQKPKRRLGPLIKTMLVVATMTLALSTPAFAWWGKQETAPDASSKKDKERAQAAVKERRDDEGDFDKDQKKISAMNVLLPISNCAECRKVRFELSASNGCYTWQNSHPQLVAMTDLQGNSLDHGRAQSPGECINRVFLEAKTLKETKSIILITARDTNSGTVLKCNTKVGMIDRLDIFTRSKQFSVNSNQQLTVVGYDDDDNIFNSMDGFSFDWTITEGTDIIKKFSAPDTGSRQSHHTDFFFIRSMKAGFASVAVKLEEPGYENVKLVTKKLTVVDPFIILPAEPVYILPTSEFDFSLAHLNMEADGTENRPIKVPSAQFKWSTAQSEIGSINDDGKFRSKLSEGEAAILVVDQQMKNNTAEGSINVVYPYRMEVSIRDVTNKDVLAKLHAGDDVESMQAWSLGLDLFDVSGACKEDQDDLSDTHILIEEHFYSIKMHLFDKEGHRITLTENLRFKSLNLDSQWVEVVKANNIGSELVIKTKKITADTVKLNSQHKLDEIVPVPANSERYSWSASRLTQEKELIITKPVKIQHPTNLVLLPFLPTATETHGSGEVWNLSSKGGSGTYMWSIVDLSVASVQGSAQVKSVAIGKTQLICRDNKNHNNWDAIDVEVAQLNQLSWVEEQVEVKARTPAAATRADQARPLGETRILSLIALDSRGRKFTNCTSVRPQYELRGETFASVNSDYDSTSSHSKYSLLRDYVSDATNFELLKLRQRFDEQADAVLGSSLAQEGTPKLSEELMRHNNFGICAQQEILGENEGLARLKASFVIHDYLNGPGRLLQSEFAEIAVYNPLVSVKPLYRPFMSDLYSQSQLGQEYQSFEAFYDDWKLTLQFGASITWKVVGGSNFWPDQAQNYKTSWSHTALTGTSSPQIFEIKTLSIMTSESEFELKCLAAEKQDQSQRAKITLQQASKSTRSLLRPALHETQVELHCEPPKSLKILWAQDFKPNVNDQRPLKQLPKSRIVHNERTHFVLVNSRHSVRYLVLDSDLMVSFNSSSVLTNVYASDESMAQVSLSDPLSDSSDRAYPADVISGLYDKRTVSFNNSTGKVTLTAEASHYLLDYTGGKKEGLWGFSGGEKAQSVTRGDYKSSINGYAQKLSTGPVRSQMTIEVVRNVDVEPKFKSLYIGTQQQTYRLRILHGSGAFAVTVNNTKLVDIVQKDRDIFLTPKELGGLKIMVEDLELPQSEVATAELLISDIVKLTLWAPLTLIEKGDDMILTVSAYDAFMNQFDPDQYALMRFNIETETMGLRRTGGLQSTQEPNQIRNFRTYGREPGIYQLTAFTFAFFNPNTDVNAKAGNIVSDMLRIEVFPILEIYPSDLLIIPNMRYTLQIVGGPKTMAKSQQLDGSHVEIKFAIENTKVASIDRFREVTGHEVGDAILKYEIIQLRSQSTLIQPQFSHEQDGKGVLAPIQPASRVVSKKTVRIRVRLITEIEIPFTHQRQIYSGSLIKMIAVLKYGEELFHHGVAPISYSWVVSEGRVLNLDIPTKQELAQTHGMASNLVMTSRYIRNNLQNKDQVEFFTAFNSSSVYARGDHEGETLVTCQLAIEYPAQYKHDQNWYKASVTVKVIDRLTIAVPQYSSQGEKETHMYLVPPQTLTKIETNKKTRLKLGYSQQSVFDYSTQSYKYQESTSPIIELVNDEAIRTFDKYGKVTLLVEEGGAFSDQMVMLNVKVADVYTLATLKSYDALSLPLGSSLSLPIHLQDDHGHKFADKISGVAINIYLSHPKVVHVSLDQYNQTLTIQSMGSGDCNIFMFLEDRPHIFDVIRVRVSGAVLPLSPVYIHMGGEINFRVDSTDGASHREDQSASQVLWSSSNPSVLSIDSVTGRAVGKREGKSDVLISNHMNAASIVHVSRVAFAQLDQKSQLMIQANNQGSNSLSSDPEYRVRIRLFLDKQPDETMPTVQFDGITLIKQHIDITCESDNPEFVLARGEVNDLEGFFCVMSYVRGADSRTMPKFVKISATASGKDQDGKKIYSEKVIDFEMQLISEIMVETKYAQGIELCNNYRTASIRVFSSSDFKVGFNYGAPEEDGHLVLHQVTPVDSRTNEYNMTVQVPVQVSHSFDVILTLSHQYASKPRLIHLKFLADQNCQKESKSWSDTILGSNDVQTTTKNTYNAEVQTPQVTGTQGETSWLSYLIFFLAVVLIAVFVLITFFEIDVSYMWDQKFGKGSRVASANQPRYQQQYARYQTNMSMSGDGIRDSRASKRQPLSRDQTSFNSFGKDLSGQSVSFPRKARTSQFQHDQHQPIRNLDDFSLRRDATQQHSASRNSRFDSIQDSARYY